jgi:hypothetical protein
VPLYNLTPTEQKYIEFTITNHMLDSLLHKLSFKPFAQARKLHCYYFTLKVVNLIVLYDFVRETVLDLTTFICDTYLFYDKVSVRCNSWCKKTSTLLHQEIQNTCTKMMLSDTTSKIMVLSQYNWKTQSTKTDCLECTISLLIFSTCALTQLTSFLVKAVKFLILKQEWYIFFLNFSHK